jgi:2,3-bisphosphoglycerate-independent phosphoglycerate mutase
MSERRPGDRPLALIIIDGWGCAPPGPANAISVATTPTMDRLLRHSPWTTVEASGAAVGLPAGQIGNSEVGHLNIGAGYTVLQDLPRIDQEIQSGRFFRNAALIGAIDSAKATRIHLMGLYSDGGVHSHASHCRALAEMAVDRGATEVLMHLFLDGRDVPPRQALADVEELEAWLPQRSETRVASIMGRFYAMDRDKRWDRTESAYRALVLGDGARADRASDAIRRSYTQGTGDEFVVPTVMV